MPYLLPVPAILVNMPNVALTAKGTGTFKAEEGADPYVGEIGKQHHEEETKIEIVYPFYLELQVVNALVDAHPYEEVAYDIFTMDNMHYGIGAGVIGELESPVSEERFLKMLKALLVLKWYGTRPYVEKRYKR